MLLTESVLQMAKLRNGLASSEIQTSESRHWKNTSYNSKTNCVSVRHAQIRLRTDRKHHRQRTLPTIWETTPCIFFLSSLPLHPFFYLCSHPHARVFSAFLWLTSPILPPFAVIIDYLATTDHTPPYRIRHLLKSALRLITSQEKGTRWIRLKFWGRDSV
jgi:hypothetical protein